mmetsp:Transcript_19769/g.62236  ORF Transcript_19769/g.62236 Transcript_19769/m.62236 type:complete len:248 (-) Transcript_19769:259-1002(-)
MATSKASRRPLAWVSVVVVATRARERVNYFRVPKTGSTLMTGFLQHRVSECDGAEVVVHGHGQGCNERKLESQCNASALPPSAGRVFGVLRYPPARMVSVINHMRKVDDQPKFHTPDNLYDWLVATLGGCDSVDCRVRRLERAYDSVHRVILYPEAYFLAADDPILVCYHQGYLIDRLNTALRAILGDRCDLLDTAARMNTNDNATYHWADLAASKLVHGTCSLYPEDCALWRSHCGTDILADGSDL